MSRETFCSTVLREVEFYFSSDLLFINLLSPDYGISLKGEVSPNSWLKFFRVRRAEETANACLKDALEVSRRQRNCGCNLRTDGQSDRESRPLCAEGREGVAS